MMICKRGDIVLVKFPMPDLKLYKPRPALIIQSDKNNARLKNVIFLQISSNLSYKDEETQFLIESDSLEGKQSGLFTDSVVKAEMVFTLPKKFVSKKLGSLPKDIMGKINKCICFSLDLK